MSTFGGWLQKHLLNNKDIEDQLYLLAQTPSSTVVTFQGYEINGNTFYTIAQDKKSTNQNSGVRFDAIMNEGPNDTYYGYIEDIWELEYGPSFKVPLFRCKWVNKTGGGVQVDKLYGMTTVDLNNLGYRDEPFVLAKDVAQVFYVKDMSTKPRKRKHKETNTSNDEPKRHIVLSGKRNIVGVEDKTDMSEDYNQFDEIPPFRASKEAKKVAQLGQQDNQAIAHFVVQPYDDPETASMIEREARAQEHQLITKITIPRLKCFHFILLIIDLHKGVVKVMDSKRKEHAEWADMAVILQRAWKRFITTVPGKWKPELTFEDYPERGNNLCGYYVCTFIRDMTCPKGGDAQIHATRV
ncbi:hypothetical protein QYE76_009745 [Lolium multiflorum]|uniref:DUF4216 domain-containing protein n=1 Tax=Lolium multiflorum TaxID=4521 RepID=A0AAD8X181_LOLMU|nr:hypothetical protein QYE76_009745 [Lolium multiflorum]